MHFSSDLLNIDFCLGVFVNDYRHFIVAFVGQFCMQLADLEIFMCPPNATKLGVSWPGAILGESFCIARWCLETGSGARFLLNPRRILTVAILKVERLEEQ